MLVFGWFVPLVLLLAVPVLHPSWLWEGVAEKAPRMAC